MKIVLHSDDINLLSYWKKVLDEECIVVDDIEELSAYSSSLIVLNYTALGSKYKETIVKLREKQNDLFVLHRVPNISKAKELLSLGVKAYGNALMKAHFFLSAIDTVKENMVWLHPEFTSELITQIPKTDENTKDKELEKLSQREKDVALLLRDAKRYKEIAELLEITPRTVKAHAQSIYKKLQVSDRLSLALLLK